VIYILRTPCDSSMGKKQPFLPFVSAFACLFHHSSLVWASLVSLVVPTSHNLAVSDSPTLILDGPIQHLAFAEGVFARVSIEG